MDEYCPHVIYTLALIENAGLKTVYVILLNLKINELPFYELKYIASSYARLCHHPVCIKRNYN